MSEKRVQMASRYLKRKRDVAMQKNLFKTLTEPITNSDDAYRILERNGSNTDSCPIEIFIDGIKRLVQIKENAGGMNEKDLDKFKEYGSANSVAYKGFGTRGMFGQGVSDVLF